MNDFSIGDQTMVMWPVPVFGPAVVTPIPTVIKASAAKTKVCKKKVCLKDDEKSVKAMGCMYINPAYPIPGMGTLKVFKLAPNQLTKKVKVEGKPVILKGIMFDAVFEVMMPGMQLPPPAMGGAPDSMMKYMGGKGQFVELNNMKVKMG